VTAALPPAGWYPDPSGAPIQRYFDGHDWTEHRAPPRPRLSDQQRAGLLDVVVAREVARGAGVAMRTPHEAVLHYGGSGGLSAAAHIVFALFTIFTCGLVGIIWIIAAAAGQAGAGERRLSLWVDQDGNILKS